MANAWLRLWHDMPNDPKWRTIARVSGQPIATVMAVYIHLLVSASRNVTTCHGVSLRGHIDVTTEDLASALDVTEDVIDSILHAMQGRVLDGDLISGWEKRQVLKEDNGNVSQTAKSPAERKRAQREREKLRKHNADCHDESRRVTHLSRQVTTDKDTDTELNPTHNARESIPTSESNGAPLQTAEPEYLDGLSEPIGKFSMCAGTMKVKSIGALIGRTEAAVRTKARELGISMMLRGDFHQSAKYSQRDIEQARQLHQRGMQRREIARKLGMPLR
ncbi:hypothetical protein ACVQ2Y_005105, partial [Escherichia coli]